MKKISIITFCILVLGTIAISCEKDDICAESTPTTPQLIVRFYDSANQEDTKTVTDLIAYGLDDNNEIVPLNNLVITTTDSLVIPLRTDQDLTKIVFHKDFGVDDNGTPSDESDDVVLGNPDIVDIAYTREDIYVSRACGFKTIFKDLSISINNDGDSWILSNELINTTVENEISAHVKIYH